MIRFVDLSSSHTGHQFAWYDTVRDKFLDFSGQCAFDSWEDFKSCYTGDDLKRFNSLRPKEAPRTDAWPAIIWPGISGLVDDCGGTKCFMEPSFGTLSHCIKFLYKGHRCNFWITHEAFEDGFYEKQIKDGIKKAIKDYEKTIEKQ